MNHLIPLRPPPLLQVPRSSPEVAPLSATIPTSCRLTIIEMGGFHSTMLPVWKSGEIIGGAAYIADAVTKIRRNSDPILISNGDVFTGQTSALENGDVFVMQFLNQLRFDAMTLGIHDFDEGQEVLAARISKAKFPILAANLGTEDGVHISRSPYAILKKVLPYAILERGMQTIAIIGLMKEDTPLFQCPRNLEGLKFWNAKESVLYWIKEIMNWKPNVIIIQYNKLSEAEELAEKLNEAIKTIGVKGQPPLLVFIGGHLEEKPRQGQNYLIMQGTDRGYKLGIIKIKRELRGPKFAPEYAIISAKSYIPEDKISKLVEAVQKKIKQQDELLGYSKTTLQRHRYHDCTLGILATESMRKVADADIAFLSSGTLKLDIPPGPVYCSNLDNSIPFKDNVVLLEMTGEQVQSVLEQSAKLEADSGGSGGKVLQVAGIRFKYSVSKEKGKRILESSINGELIEKMNVYKAAVSNYLVEGGDGYEQFGKSVMLGVKGELKEAMKRYIKEYGTLELERDFRIEDLS